MAKIRYVPDRHGMRDLAQSKPVGDACVRAAEHGAAWAKSAPLKGGPSDRISEYRAGFKAMPAKVVVGGETRAGAILINDSDVERIFGGRNRTLYRAINAIEGVSL
ncbi:hypothetical protein LWF01_02965 [Saxibacter everestensis]|uniref:Uncharacterized protein n=1 Tax=Saxibacter everestensis TaxID=2909229 RepID=A0ABY8QUS1_9MICO|nr:hypothetical protein LWF01_02965 [Brevibacteriaceae bacterium ZFBP1038]